MDHQLIRAGIINKLKEFNAYIDDELPDYIMVMIANKKTIQQIANDLQLFLGDNTETFTHWLQRVLSNPVLLRAEELPPHVPSLSPNHTYTSPGSKRPVSLTEGPMTRTPSPSARPLKVSKQDDEDDEDDVLPVNIIQRIKLPPEHKEERKPLHRIEEPRRTRDQDLRSLIRRRKAETLNEEIDESVNTRRGGVSSVVQVPDKPERPRESRGTSRLLQRAIHDIHGHKKGDGIKKKLSRPHTIKPEEIQREEVVQVEGPDFVDEFRNEGEEDVVEETVEEATEEEEEEEEKEEALSDKEDNEEAITKDMEAATLAAIRKVLPSQDNNDLRFLLNKGKNKKLESAKDKSTRFVVTMEGMEDTFTEEEEDNVKQGKVGMAERCRFWPNCKNGDSCPFHHPTVSCRMFPNCKYGRKCCFVHPVCKFDGRCMKDDCPYLHTVPKVKNVQPRVMPNYRTSPQFTYGSGAMYGGGNWTKNRFPNKKSLKWTPTKPLNERKFAVTDSDTTSMPVQ